MAISIKTQQENQSLQKSDLAKYKKKKKTKKSPIRKVKLLQKFLALLSNAYKGTEEINPKGNYI